MHNEGFSVFEASDGVEALAKLAANKADLVILDVMMPNMDGWQLCARLRASGDVPLLIVPEKASALLARFPWGHTLMGQPPVP